MNYPIVQYDIHTLVKKTKIYSIIQTILGIVFVPSLVLFIIFNNSYQESLNRPFDPNNPYVSDYASSTQWMISLMFMMSSLMFSLSITFAEMVLYSKAISILSDDEKKKLKNVVPLLLVNLITFGLSSFIIHRINSKIIKNSISKKSVTVNFVNPDIPYYPSHVEEMGNKTWTQKHNKKPSVDEKINRIKEVTELKERGFISEEEFLKLKDEIIKNS